MGARQSARDPEVKAAFGIGLRPRHGDALIRGGTGRPDFLEIISENFLSVGAGGRLAPAGGRLARTLESLRSSHPMAMHGVSLSVGSPEGARPEYLDALAALAARAEPWIISDHLCRTRWGAHQSHDLLPLPLTEEVLSRVAVNVLRAQDALKRPLALENPSAYVDFSFSEMSEGAFLSELSRRTGCELLLDVNNLWVNALNLGWDLEEALASLPWSRVRQLHVAGHSVDEGGARIDTHDRAPDEAVWSLYRRAIRLAPDASTLIEWDDRLPELEVLVSQLDRARSERELALAGACGAAGREVPAPASRVRGASTPPGDVSFSGCEEGFFGAVTGDNAPVPGLREDCPVGAERGVAIYRRAYLARCVSVLRSLFPALVELMEEPGFSRMAETYVRTCPPGHESIDRIGDGLAGFLETAHVDFDFGVELAWFADLARLEQARSEVFSAPDDEVPAARLFIARWDVLRAYQELSRGEAPALPEAGERGVLVWREGEAIRSAHIAADDALRAGKELSASPPERAASFPPGPRRDPSSACSRDWREASSGSRPGTAP